MKNYINHADAIEDTATGRWIPKDDQNRDYTQVREEISSGAAQVSDAVPPPPRESNGRQIVIDLNGDGTIDKDAARIIIDAINKATE